MPLRLSHSVNKVLENPRWRQTFTIFKTTRTPDEHGRAVIERISITARCVIQPSGGEDLDRLDEGDRGNQAITVWTNEPLSTGTDNELPDEIEWRGVRHMARYVQGWEDYGNGYCKAVCVAQKMKERASQ